jgi:uncharacterized paraquat-inducible protein A
MAIRVTCENGHDLKVKEKYAGREGICPHCKAKVKVPERQAISDTSIMAILGAAEGPPSQVASESHGPPQSPRTKSCPRCQTLVSKAYRACPKCSLYLPLVLGRQAT